METVELADGIQAEPFTQRSGLGGRPYQSYRLLRPDGAPFAVIWEHPSTCQWHVDARPRFSNPRGYHSKREAAFAAVLEATR